MNCVCMASNPTLNPHCLNPLVSVGKAKRHVLLHTPLELFFGLAMEDTHLWHSTGALQNNSSPKFNKISNSRGICAKLDEESKKEESTKSKQSLFGSVVDALDFSQVRSAEDAQLLEEAREATRSGDKMSREQYGALRRKIGGTYKDFFKSYVDVDGQYVEEGWVDKTCKVCKKDTKGELRQVDKLGRYVHVECLEKSRSGNFFTRLFSR